MRSPSLVFTRRIHVLHDLFTRTTAGKLAELEGKALPPLENDVQLQDRNGETIATVRSMDSLVSHLEPFSYLKKLPLENPVYRIVQLMKFPPSQKGLVGFKRAGTGKELHVTTTSSDGTWRHTVSKAYEFLSKGWRVEFHVRPISKNKGNTIDWALRNALHMRPEVINAAMPEGTQMLMPPVQDGIELLWVLEHEKNRLKQGWPHRKPIQSKMPIGTGIAKAARAGKQIVQPKDRRSLCHKSSDTHIWEAHSNPQAEDDVDRENPENPISKRSRESAPKKKISLPGPEISDEISSTQVHRLPAGGDMKASANTYTYSRGVLVTTDVDIEGSSVSDSKRSSKTAPDLQHKSASDMEHSIQSVQEEEPLENFIRHTWKRNEAGEPQDAFSRRKLDIDWKTAKIHPNGVNMTTMRFPYTQQEPSTSNQVERPQAGTKTSRNAITLWYANR